MKRFLIGLVAIVAVVFVGGVQKVGAAEPQGSTAVVKQSQAARAVVYDYIVLDRPVKFVGFTRGALRAGDGVDQPVLVVTESVNLEGVKRSLGKDSVIFLGDTIESGMLQSVGGTTKLVDSAGNVTNLVSGQRVIVVPASPGGEDPTVSAITCTECADLATNTCSSNGVKSVKCGDGGPCSFSCHPAPKPVPAG